jgi:hypothetical protein
MDVSSTSSTLDGLDSSRPRKGIPAGVFPFTFVVVGFAITFIAHCLLRGPNVNQAALSLFLWINILINYWELCLLLRASQIDHDADGLKQNYCGNELSAAAKLFTSRIRIREALSPTYWAGVWTVYSLFDDAYRDKKSFGFNIDVCNGIFTIFPSVFLLTAMTAQYVPATTLGIVAVAVFYQMLYGTVVYAFSFALNGQHRGHTRANVAMFVGGSNGLWVIFPLWGIVVAIILITTNSYVALD